MEYLPSGSISLGFLKHLLSEHERIGDGSVMDKGGLKSSMCEDREWENFDGEGVWTGRVGGFGSTKWG